MLFDKIISRHSLDCVLVSVALFCLCSCSSPKSRIILWECDGSVLTVDSMSSEKFLVDSGIRYDLYFATRHEDDLHVDGLKFLLDISDDSISYVVDTIGVKLTENGSWIGRSRIGSSECRYLVRENIQFDSSDSISVSLKSLLGENVDGINWIALELKQK